jgi:hypothetical protein
MERRGLFSFDSEADLAAVHQALLPAGETVTEELLDVLAYHQEASEVSVTTELVETAHEAIFASLLEVYTGDSDEFDAWLRDHPELEVHLEGHEHAERRAWHPVGPAGAVVAVTFQQEVEAAAEMVRRQAVGRYYRERLDFE